MSPPATAGFRSIALLPWCLAFLHRHFPPQSPPPHPFNPSLHSPRPGIAPWFLNSSSQLLCRPGELHPCSGYAWLQQRLSDPHSFRQPQVRCFTLGLKCFSSDSDNRPTLVIGLLLQFPQLLRAGPVLLTLLFFPLVPSSYEFCVGLYSLFHWSGPPAHLSCCSACTSVSEAVFLMYPWIHVSM